MIRAIDINLIRIDGGTQSRVRVDTDVVAEYAEIIFAGTELPPLSVMFDGAEYWLCDGFHRYH